MNKLSPQRKKLILIFFGVLFVFFVLGGTVLVSGKLIHHDKGYSCEHYCVNTSFGCININTEGFDNITKKAGENVTYLGIKRLTQNKFSKLCGTDTLRLFLFD